VKRLCIVTDLDVVCNGPDTGEAGDQCFRRGPLGAAAHRSGKRDVAVLRHRRYADRHCAAETAANTRALIGLTPVKFRARPISIDAAITPQK
jgi:hypothetical protein